MSKGMKKLTGMLLSLMMCVCAVFGLTYLINVDAAVENAKVTLSSSDVLKVTDSKGTNPYKFYTTANASKSVPAMNQWIKTDGGGLDVSDLTAGKTIYFANSTSPALAEIVAVKLPASPVLSVAKYDPLATETDKLFSFKTKVNVITTQTIKGKSKTTVKATAVDVPKDRIEIRIGVNGSWKSYSDFITTIAKYQKDGSTIYARIKAAVNQTCTYDSNSNIYLFADGDDKIKPVTEDGQTFDKSSTVRSGIPKAVKIVKKVNGPAVSIDYENHCMIIKKGQEYAKGSSVDAEPELKYYTEVISTIPSKVYFGTNGSVSKEEYYTVRTTGNSKNATSLPTFITVPADVDFEGVATISGLPKETAVLSIKSTKGVAYQYAIVDLTNEDYKDLIDDSKNFNYRNTKVKWSTVKANNYGFVKANLSWSKVEGKQVLVRKAATKTTFSSKVMVFNAPTKDKGWRKIEQKNYVASFLTGGVGTDCVGITEPVYKVATKTVEFSVNGASSVDKNKIKVMNGKTVVEAAVSVTSATKVSIDAGKFDETNSGMVEIIFEDDYATDAAKSKIFGRRFKLTYDNKAPIKKAHTMVKGKLVITFDSKLAKKATDGTVTPVTAGEDVSNLFGIKEVSTANVNIDKAVYSIVSGGSKIEISFTVGSATSCSVKEITVATKTTGTKLSDGAGNELAGLSIDKIANPGYKEAASTS